MSFAHPSSGAAQTEETDMGLTKVPLVQRSKETTRTMVRRSLQLYWRLKIHWNNTGGWAKNTDDRYRTDGQAYLKFENPLVCVECCAGDRGLLRAQTSHPGVNSAALQQ